eukprot:TRINITY_DN10820_c0_g1_i1.p1 TRINITY_DN10820_c0_g1~~TRINITY_DN10820_c0_g1_i1.p1  ORF type:complete len:381 (+),score=118.84 TRINITY_DN10820_c0_g1_i1:109-1251(+)
MLQPDESEIETFTLVKKDVNLRCDSIIITESEYTIKERIIERERAFVAPPRDIDENRRRLEEERRRRQEEEEKLREKIRIAEETAKRLEDRLRQKGNEGSEDDTKKKAEAEKLRDEERKQLYLESKKKQTEEAKRRREEEERRKAADYALVIERKKAEEEAKRREIERQLGIMELSYSTPINVQEEDHENIPGWRKIFVTVLEARDLIACNVHDGESDPFVVCKHLDSDGNIKVKHKTKVVQKNRLCPMWDEMMEYRDFLKEDLLEVSVWDNGMTGFDFMGEVVLSRSEVKHGGAIWFPLSDRPKHARRGAHPSQDRKFGPEKAKKEKKEKDKKAAFAKKSLSGDKIFADVTKGRNVMKELVRGKRKITGEVRLAFETIY